MLVNWKRYAVAGDLHEPAGPGSGGVVGVHGGGALALVVFVHFLGGEEREGAIRDIYAVYGSPVAELAALVVLAGLLAGLSALLISALGALRRRT